MSAVLNGTNQAFRVVSQLGLGNSDQNGWALSALFKRSRIGHTAGEAIACRGNGSSGTTYGQIDIAPTTDLVRGRRYAGAGDAIDGPAITSTSEWQHAVVYFPPTDGVSRTCRLWVNGVASGTVTSTRSSTNALEALYIGRTGGTINLQYFGGKVAHVTVLQGEPTLAEAILLRTTVPEAITFNTAVPVAYFDLLSGGSSSIGGFELEAINSPTFDTEDHPALAGAGSSDAPYLIVPRRQLFVTRRVIQH